jgi:dihydroorotase
MDFVIKGGMLINEGQRHVADLWLKDGRIHQIAPTISRPNAKEINAEGLYVVPGIIDDQVHFREPGLTHKAEIHTESRAAVAGGVTSFMEMPNTVPPTLTQALLEEKYARAANVSLSNYSFFMGASNDNLDEVLRTDGRKVCGIKAFMGSSTGNMLVDDPKTLERLFASAPILVATHCEDEATIRANLAVYKARFGDVIPMECHPEIRSAEGCLKSSELAVSLAKKYGTRLHVLHISTEDELYLFDNQLPLKEKRITSEVCVHHLYFNKNDYERLGALIKCNPAIKEQHHQTALMAALLDDRLDIVATDHAPHTWAEKQQAYTKAPSGLPLVQHALNVMLEFYHQNRISLEKIVEKMCHSPALCFEIEDRGFLREGYWADIALVDLESFLRVGKDNLHYKCGWSPFEGRQFVGKVTHTFVNGHLAYENGRFNETQKGQRLLFKRQ